MVNDNSQPVAVNTFWKLWRMAESKSSRGDVSDSADSRFHRSAPVEKKILPES
jgi:hypothetical protein